MQLPHTGLKLLSLRPIAQWRQSFGRCHACGQHNDAPCAKHRLWARSHVSAKGMIAAVHPCNTAATHNAAANAALALRMVRAAAPSSS
jgi:hypothetical protein